jgi:hypothetical protein
MKIVKVAGGLGNQMFQYAFARALEVRSGEDVYLDTSTYEYMPAHNGFELDRLFAVQYRLAREEDIRRLGTRPRSFFSKLRRKYFTKRTHYIDRSFRYDPYVFALGGDRYLEGYWQSEKYFAPIADRLRQEFHFISDPGPQNWQILGETIQQLDAKTSRQRALVSVHVRRGDSLRQPETQVCTEAYYRNALGLAKQQFIRPHFLVFSDDLSWCRTHLDLEKGDATFVDWNRGADSWRDMWLMSRCSGHIIANSSFSWWGAWLDPHPDKLVIAPARWSFSEQRVFAYYRYDFRDIVPESWVRVPIV